MAEYPYTASGWVVVAGSALYRETTMNGSLVLLAVALMECQLSAEPTEGEISDIILAVEKDFEEQTNRTLIKGSITEYFDIGPSQNKVFLKGFPVATTPVVQVWEDSEWSFESGDLLVENSDYRVDREKGIIMLDIYDSFEMGNHSLKVTYTAGYDTTTFPLNAARILARQVAHWHHLMTKQRAWIESETTPAGGTMLRYIGGNYIPEYKALVERWTR